MCLYSNTWPKFCFPGFHWPIYNANYWISNGHLQSSVVVPVIQLKCSEAADYMTWLLAVGNQIKKISCSSGWTVQRRIHLTKHANENSLQKHITPDRVNNLCQLSNLLTRLISTCFWILNTLFFLHEPTSHIWIERKHFLLQLSTTLSFPATVWLRMNKSDLKTGRRADCHI